MPAPSDNSETSINSLSAQLAGTDLSNLYGVIDRDNVHGLNLTVPEHAKAVIKPWDERDDNGRWVESNVDDQMIIHVPFTENVRVKSILLKIGRGEQTPRNLKIFANRPTIVSFDELESGTAKPQLNISLQEGETGVVEYPMRVAAFGSVSSLDLFFGDSVGTDSSRIYFIGFKGDRRNIKKLVDSKLEVPAPNAADAPISDRVGNRVGGRVDTAR